MSVINFYSKSNQSNHFGFHSLGVYLIWIGVSIFNFHSWENLFDVDILYWDVISSIKSKRVLFSSLGFVLFWVFFKYCSSKQKGSKSIPSSNAQMKICCKEIFWCLYGTVICNIDNHDKKKNQLCCEFGLSFFFWFV